jgi:hypothetical protein
VFYFWLKIWVIIVIAVGEEIIDKISMKQEKILLKEELNTLKRIDLQIINIVLNIMEEIQNYKLSRNCILKRTN